MSPGALIRLAPFPAAFAAWMLSGSPLPMAFSAAFTVLAAAAGRVFRGETSGFYTRLLSPFLLLALTVWQLRLFETGGALNYSATLPAAFHFGLALLWIGSVDSFLVRNRVGGAARLHAGLAGGLLVWAASFATELYDFSAWQVYPVAALPLVLLLAALFLDRVSLARLLPLGAGLVLGLSAISLGLEQSADRASAWWRARNAGDSALSPDDRVPFDNTTSDLGGGSRRLPRSADIHYDDRARLFLRTESPALFRSWLEDTLYVRTSTVSVFETDELLAPVRSGRWIYDIDDGEPDLYIPLRRDPLASHSDYTLFIEKSGSNALPLLADTSSIKAAAVYEFADDWYQFSPEENVRRLRYSGTVPEFAPPALSPFLSTGHLRNPSGPDIYLNLPPTPLAARVTRLCDALDPDEALESIRALLDERATYSTSYEVPPDVSPVEHLLFERGSGHCELYAAASLMMLRAAGFPSRLAYGYTGGVVDIERKTVAFRDRDFHAWTEILGPDNRWLIFDATPFPGDGSGRSPARTTLADLDWSAYTNISEGSGAEGARGSAFLSGFGVVTAFLSRHFLALTWGGIFLFGGVHWLRSRRRRTGESAAGSPSAPVSGDRPGYLREVEACGTALGHERDAGETWREFLDRISVGVELPSCLEETIRYHYGILYGRDEPDRERESLLAEDIRAWKKAELSR